MCLVTASLILDTSLTRINKLNIVQSSAPQESLPIFTVIAVGYVITQYLIMRFVKRRGKDMRFNRQLHTIATAVQYVLSAVVILVILELWVLSYYSTVLLTVTIVISYTLAIIMIGLLAERFFSWFRSNRNVVVLSYGVASGIFVINAGITMVFLTNLLSVKPAEVYDFLSLGSIGTLLGILYSAFTYRKSCLVICMVR
jgi:hypothetical protein